MKLEQNLWSKLASYTKGRLLSKYDPSTLVPSINEEQEGLEADHKGFYLGIKSSTGEPLLRVGFLEDSTNILSSLNRAVEAAYADLSARGVPSKVVQTSTLYFTVVNDVTFTNNGLAWDENEDGVYFSWGDTYKGLYLPYQIKQMSVKKSEIMNRLCSWESGVPSNLWRLPEGMVHRLSCDSFFWT